MQRSSVIATVIAAGGILIAGSVASVAVINAASSSQPESETIQLVTAEQTPSATAETPAADTPAVTAAAPALPTVEAAPLPEIPVVEEVAPAPQTQAAPAPRTQAAAAPSPAAKPTPKPTKEQAAQKNRKPSARPTSTPSTDASSSDDTPEVRELSGEKAVDLVLQATGGGTARSVEKVGHQGYEAWAVQLTRHDGSIVTGYVERSTGVIFDWVVNVEAPAAAAPTAGSGSGSSEHEDEHEDDGDDD
jgi:outer membrane biosynthesis protein TonB